MGPYVAPSRFGRLDVRAGPPDRLFELLPAAGGRGIAGVVGGVVIVELAFSLPGEQPKDAQVYVGHDRVPAGSTGIETATASGSSWGGSSETMSLNPTTPSAPTGCGGRPHSGQATRYAAAPGLNRNRHLVQPMWVIATPFGRSPGAAPPRRRTAAATEEQTLVVVEPRSGVEPHGQEPSLLRWPWPTASLPLWMGTSPRKQEERGLTERTVSLAGHSSRSASLETC